jgi:hypothetical protein
MSSGSLTRRQFLTLPIALAALGPRVVVGGEAETRHGAYMVEVGVLYDVMTFRLDGTITQAVDRAARQYEITVAGEGSGIANRVESRGRLVDGWWAPTRTLSWLQVRGRESRSEVVYDVGTRTIDYRSRSETFFLRRVRTVEDRIAMPAGRHVDDVLSALLNYVDGVWKPDPAGLYRTWVVRRRKRDDEGPDDVDPDARAELAPFEMRLDPEGATSKQTAVFDMTRFSSWARRDRPARIVFGANRRPELITASLILGTSMRIQFRDV